jgi:signal transduction histidine kinase
MAALLVAIAGIAVGLIGEQLGHGFEQVPWIPLADLATGWAMIASGLVAAYARPAQPAGRRLVIAGFLWFVGSFMQMDDPRLGSVSFVFQGYFDLVLILIALSFPARWPARTSERVVIAVAGALYVASSVVRVLVRSEDLIGRQLLSPEIGLPWVGWTDLARLAAVVVGGVLVIRRWALGTPTSRQLIGPVLAAGIASALAVSFALYYPLTALGIAPALDDDIYTPTAWAFNVVRILVPFGMLLGIVRQRAARSALADAVAAAGERPRSLDLRSVLAGAFGDPKLRVLEWDDGRSAFIDETGSSVTEQQPPLPGRATTVVRIGDRPLAMLEYDSALEQDPATVSAAVAVTRLVVNNERLFAESAHRLEEVEASRARIVEAGDIERRRIERDLHDGIQQRLVALAMFLSRAQTRAGSPGGADESLRYGATEVLAIVQDVREFASGIHPAMLSEAGLEAAVRELADRSPIPVRLDLHLVGRGSPSTLATAFFVASEALANVTKHAAASTVWVHAEDGGERLEIAVSDDGRGGVTVGGGLAGLADRVTALGGTMAVADRPGGGTSVTASLPLG